MTHPVEIAMERMSNKDRKIAEEMREAGFDDEDLYAALPTPGAVKFLEEPPEGN